MKVFVKRIQSRASKKGLKVSLQQVRDAYQSIVNDLDNPTEDEMTLVLSRLESSTQEVSEAITLSDSVATDISTDSNADVWEVVAPEDDAIALPESESIEAMQEESSEVFTSIEPASLNQDEPESALTTSSGFVLQEEDKHSLIHRQASALNVELNTSELTTIAGNIADNYASFEDACRRIQSVIVMVLDQRFERASGVLDDTLLTILNRASSNFQSLNGRASQGFTAIAQELKRVDSDFKSKSSALEQNLKQYLL